MFELDSGGNRPSPDRHAHAKPVMGATVSPGPNPGCLRQQAVLRDQPGEGLVAVILYVDIEHSVALADPDADVGVGPDRPPLRDGRRVGGSVGHAVRNEARERMFSRFAAEGTARATAVEIYGPERKDSQTVDSIGKGRGKHFAHIRTPALNVSPSETPCVEISDGPLGGCNRTQCVNWGERRCANFLAGPNSEHNVVLSGIAFVLMPLYPRFKFTNGHPDGSSNSYRPEFAASHHLVKGASADAQPIGRFRNSEQQPIPRASQLASPLAYPHGPPESLDSLWTYTWDDARITVTVTILV